MQLTVIFEVDDEHIDESWERRMKNELNRIQQNTEVGLVPVAYEVRCGTGFVDVSTK